MKRVAFAVAALLAILSPGAGALAQNFRPEVGADFMYHFDNREFAYSGDAITPSGTIHAAVLVPTAGILVQQSDNVQHRLRAGVEFAHDMGSQTWTDFFREVLFYYDGRVKTDRGVFEGVAGVFPRRFLEGAYSEAFFSDSFTFYDRNLEGILLKWRSERFRAEFACDWMGQFGYERKERFQLVSSGSWEPVPLFTLGWTGSFYHYACSVVSPGVVDNHMLEPWAKLSLPGSAWQELSIQAGLIATYQWDRKQMSAPTLPLGGEFVFTARALDIMLQNSAYVGQNLLPLYDKPDLAGNRYGGDLYFGQPFYTGFYDRIELAWAPRISRHVSLRLSARAHFSAAGFLGWQQLVSLRFCFPE